MIGHLVLNWITGHWILAAIAGLAVLVFCVPGVGGPLLRALLTTRPGLVALTLGLALGVGSWYGSDRYASGVHDGQSADAAKVFAANAAVASWRLAAENLQRAIDAQNDAAAQAQADAQRDQLLATQAITAAATAEVEYKRRRQEIDAQAARDRSACAAVFVPGLE